MKDRLLVIDIGTQSLRASIVESDGNILAFSQQKYETPFFSPEEGFAEQDADYYMDKLAVATTELYNNSREELESVQAMVMVSIRDSSVILDENIKPIRPAILWIDQRTVRLKGDPNLKAYEKLMMSLVGMRDAARMNSERTPSFWIEKHEPENWKKMKYYVTLPAYFNYRITGNLVVSSADCAGHYPIKFKDGKWYPKNHFKYDIFHIPYDSLCPLVQPGDVIGMVSEEFSSLSHIPAGLKLLASGSDKSCETFGNGCIDKSAASISLGTACSIDVVDSKYSEPESFLPAYKAPYDGSYDLEVQIYRGLWMIHWYLENFGDNDKNDAKKEGISVEQFLDKKMREIRPGCDGLVLQPYWGPGLARPNAKGSIIGFSGVHTRFHLYRSLIEGIAFALREGLDIIMKKTHKVPDYIVISGGGSTSNIFCQIITDVFGIPCYKSYSAESSTMGGAMSGFMTLGVFKDAKEARDAMIKKGELFAVNEQNHQIYDQLYNDVYVKMYPALHKIFNRCKSFYLDTKEKLG